MAISPSADSLLDSLLAGAALDYLSDLHDGYHRARVLAAVCATSEEQFPLEAWCRAAAYILGEEVALASAGEAKRLLAERLA